MTPLLRLVGAVPLVGIALLGIIAMWVFGHVGPYGSCGMPAGPYPGAVGLYGAGVVVALGTAYFQLGAADRRSGVRRLLMAAAVTALLLVGMYWLMVAVVGPAAMCAAPH